MTRYPQVLLDGCGKSRPPTRIYSPRVVQLIVSHSINCSIPAHISTQELIAKFHYSYRAVLYLLYTYIPTEIALYFTLLKQHIKIVLLFKSINNSLTCFGQFLTVLREIFIFFKSVTKDKLFRFVEACLLYLLCFVLILRSLVVAVQQPGYGRYANSTQNTTNSTGMLPQT
jgi:Mn2+/Fe2+ NRAMP family transporter